MLAPAWVGWHLFVIGAVAGMTWLGDWQFRRAMAGNTLSWAYTFEWPIFAIFAVVFWVKTVRDELNPARDGDQHAEDVSLPAGIKRPASTGPGGAAAGGAAVGDSGRPQPPDDQELAEYNAYLARLSNEVKGHGRWHGLR